MKIFSIIIIFCLPLYGCKGTYTNTNGCYKYKDGYYFVTFKNNSHEILLVPKISPMIDKKDFYLLDEYYHIMNDTLIIDIVNESHIFISDKANDTKIKVHHPTIELKPEKTVQQLFKSNASFKYIKIDNYLFKQCN